MARRVPVIGDDSTPTDETLAASLACVAVGLVPNRALEHLLPGAGIGGMGVWLTCSGSGVGSSINSTDLAPISRR
jgi:hypothetical protein